MFFPFPYKYFQQNVFLDTFLTLIDTIHLHIKYELTYDRFEGKHGKVEQLKI